MTTGRATNLRLAAILREAGLSNGKFATAIRRASERVGWPVNCDHVSVARWLRGVQPRPETADLILMVLSQTLGRPVTGKDAGIHAPGVLHDVPSAAVPPVLEHDLNVMRRRLDWLTKEALDLSQTLAALTGQAAPSSPPPMMTNAPTVYRRAALRQSARHAYHLGVTS